MFITRIAIHKTTHQFRCLPVVGDDGVDKIANDVTCGKSVFKNIDPNTNLHDALDLESGRT